jgi:SAM-dependent methyltransferase
MVAMSTIAERVQTGGEVERDPYVLGRTEQEHERLREQARVWEAATGRLLDQVGLAQGARCLDAGCGPGETMRQLAQRVGPAGRVLGADVDAALGAEAIARLHAAGHRQCSFARVDLTGGEPLPGAPFDLVYARLLLFHMSDPPAVLRRLWDVVAPGGALVVHDYDLRTTDVRPSLRTMEEWKRVVLGAFAGAGRDVSTGHALPLLLARAGLGAPDGTDVAGRLEPFGTAAPMLAAVHRSLLPAAVAQGLTTPAAAERWRDDLARDVREHGGHAALWPLLIGAWKRKPGR